MPRLLQNSADALIAVDRGISEMRALTCAGSNAAAVNRAVKLAQTAAVLAATLAYELARDEAEEAYRERARHGV